MIAIQAKETYRYILDTFTQLNLLTYDEVNQYYSVQPTIQSFAIKQIENIPEIWYRLGNAFASSIRRYNSFANRSADGYLLSLSFFDEYKSAIKSILRYLINHASTERDQILIKFHELISSSGKSRFASRFELIPLLEELVGTSIRLQDFEKLKIILGNLSDDIQMMGNKEKARYYSELQDDVILFGRSERVKRY